MEIFVLIKQVPDTETRIKISGSSGSGSSGSSIDETGIKWIVSPFDEHALEEALRQKEKVGDGATITAVCLGPERSAEALRNAYALGVDKAVHIKDDSYNVQDINYTALVLAKYIESTEAKLILCGHVAIDSQSSMVPSALAEKLGYANLNSVIELNVENNTAKVTREIEGGTASMEGPLPVVVTAAKNLNSPRYPSLKGIMAAKKKEIEVVEVSALLIKVPRIEILSIELPPPRPQGRVIEGSDVEAKVSELVTALREEAKVI